MSDTWYEASNVSDHGDHFQKIFSSRHNSKRDPQCLDNCQKPLHPSSNVSASAPEMIGLRGIFMADGQSQVGNRNSPSLADAICSFRSYRLRSLQTTVSLLPQLSRTGSTDCAKDNKDDAKSLVVFSRQPLPAAVNSIIFGVCLLFSVASVNILIVRFKQRECLRTSLVLCFARKEESR